MGDRATIHDDFCKKISKKFKNSSTFLGALEFVELRSEVRYYIVEKDAVNGRLTLLCSRSSAECE
jgi:hypothetical protein